MMPRLSLHAQFSILFMLLRDMLTPLNDLEALCQQLNLDIRILEMIKNTRYLQARSPVLKLGNIDLAWEYAQSPNDHR